MGRLIGLAVAPMAAMARLGEKRLVPLADSILRDLEGSH